IEDGTYLEEPGSGAVATIENKTVSVGTLDWFEVKSGLSAKILRLGARVSSTVELKAESTSVRLVFKPSCESDLEGYSRMVKAAKQTESSK
ncbi:unnamed protein product, partial [Ilex paraguariensis]